MGVRFFADAVDRTEVAKAFETGWLYATLRYRSGMVTERIKLLSREEVQKIADKSGRWIEWREPSETGEWWAEATFGEESDG